MNHLDYIQNAIITESKEYDSALARLDKDKMRLLHALMGLCTEAGESLDAMKKYVFYGKPLDEVNLKEEMGDLFWYLAIMADTLNLSFEEIQNRNIEKLKARYGDEFSEDKAIVRDLKTERSILER